MTSDEKREWVREHLPICAGFAAVCAEAFGPDVRLVFASEGGHAFGRPGAAGVRLVDTVVGSMRKVAT